MNIKAKLYLTSKSDLEKVINNEHWEEYINIEKHKEEIIEYLFELIDKETPMKPIIESGMFEVCKNCGEQGHRCIDFINEHNYCSNCGQKIDWSDEQ